MDPISPAAPRLSPDPWVEWGVAQITFEGQTVCGDLHLVKSFADGVLTAVVDGLGHGVEADDQIFCCAHCAAEAGVVGAADRV